MKIFLPLLCLASLALAEPPVGDGYQSSHTSHDDQHNDHYASDNQRSLSQEYGPPSDTFGSARNAPSDGYDYTAPNARSSPNARGQSQYPPATVRVSFNQRFGAAGARNSAQDHTTAAARSPSQDYAAPSARSGISQEYGPPTARSLSQEYGTPSVVAARTLSSEYGTPNARSSSSEQYGVPDEESRSNQKPQSPAFNFRSTQSARAFSQDYSTPATRAQFQTNSQSHDYAASSSRSNNEAQSYDAKSSPASRNVPSSTYDSPSSQSQFTSQDASAHRSNSQESQDYDSASQTYGAPSQRGLSETYGTPSVRGLSQEYGVPSSRSNQMTSAVPSSYSSARSAPSTTYLPAARNAAPSEQYGVPEQRNADSEAYDLAKARALEELQNQEPASYDFGYQIEDQESGSDFGHIETREENRAQGSYFVVLPDGTKQTVEYEADERGFRPRISVEPAAAAGGYDENAAEISSARSAAGPY